MEANVGEYQSFMWSAVEKISLNCKLVPVRYQEYEHGLLL